MDHSVCLIDDSSLPEKFSSTKFLNIHDPNSETDPKAIAACTLFEQAQDETPDDLSAGICCVAESSDDGAQCTIGLPDGGGASKNIVFILGKASHLQPKVASKDTIV